MFVTISKVVHPNRSISKNHNYIFSKLRLGIVCNSFSVPPSFARRLLLSRAIKASRPSRTNEVFSLIPVKRDAFSKILSSMFIVVIICFNEACISTEFIVLFKIKVDLTGFYGRADKKNHPLNPLTDRGEQNGAVIIVITYQLIPFPLPVSSNVTCGFPTLRFHGDLTSKLMQLIELVKLSASHCQKLWIG